jgi:predicted transposase/invertase (TIGR01784 family)
VFGIDKHKKILLAFLNDLFEGVHPKIKNLRFLPPHQDPEIAGLRQSIVDVLCRDVSGKQYIIEMQCAHDAAFLKRACYYASKAYISQMKPGQPFSDLEPVIFLAILEEKLFPKKQAYLSHHKLKDIFTNECDIDQFTFSFLELKKIEKSFEESKTFIEKWAYFLKHAPEVTEKELKKIAKDYPVLKSAYEALEEHNYSVEELREYDRCAMKADEIRNRIAEGEARGLAKGLVKGEAKGLAKGKAEGKAEEKRNMVLGMARKGIDKNTIAEIAQLSPEEVEQILSLQKD